MSNLAAEKAARKYGLRFKQILPAQKGYRNFSYRIVLAGGASANLIVYKNEPNILNRIKFANKVSGYLASCDSPVRRPLDKRILVISTGAQVRYASLYNYLPGHTIAWETYTKEHLKLLGQNMAQMHQSLQHFNDAPLPAVEDEYLAILDRAKKYLSEPAVSSAMRQKLNLAVDLTRLDLSMGVLSKCRNLSGRQPLHMDFVRSNILFDESNGQMFISGILDFEKAATGHPLFDICRTLAFLYVDCKFKSASKVRKYFLLSGYAKHGGGQLYSINFTNAGLSIGLEIVLVHMFWMHDFYKFLRHNPYESLKDNEHFMRTRQLLLEAGILLPAN